MSDDVKIGADFEGRLRVLVVFEPFASKALLVDLGSDPDQRTSERSPSARNGLTELSEAIGAVASAGRRDGRIPQ